MIYSRIKTTMQSSILKASYEVIQDGSPDHFIINHLVTYQ